MIESINKELQEIGFDIDEKLYTLEKTFYNRMIINGREHVQEQKTIFQMEYVGDGCELDSDGNEIEDTCFCGFDIKDTDGYSLTTVFVTCLEDIRYYVNI